SARTSRTTTASKSPSILGSAADSVGRALRRTLGTLSRFPFTSDGHDALTMLEHDHRRLETLLAQGEDTGERAVKARTTLLDTITHELKIHELIEEKVLYPALKAHKQAKDTVLEGYQEHHVADVLVEELHALSPDDERWAAKFKVLKENIEHHIEEEEGEMFRIARSVLSRAEREELGERMLEMKRARR
ncbi:MAG TPA: hemerythrin domain-containing protein, partial [Vicinamibacterales bacterium]|nr:hemerythrin domain-containing protein [Vicinamibacterales bacterium]